MTDDPVAKISTHKPTRKGQFREISRRLIPSARERRFITDLPGELAKALERAYKAGQENGPDTAASFEAESGISWMEIPAKSRGAVSTMCLFLKNERDRFGSIDVYPVLVGFGKATGPRAGPHARIALSYMRLIIEGEMYRLEKIDCHNWDVQWGWATIKPLIDLEIFEHFVESIYAPTDLFDDVLLEYLKYNGC